MAGTGRWLGFVRAHERNPDERSMDKKNGGNYPYIYGSSEVRIFADDSLRQAKGGNGFTSELDAMSE
jgi:hypothetical protein